MALQPGEVLNQRYKILSVIAQGGMGAVYRAQDLTLDIDVAVKENLKGTESIARQFRREGTILASLAHPNLPRVTDHFVTENGSQYLVMDFIEGEDLREMIKRLGQLPEDLVTRVGITICDALDYLHSRQPPILHRDIKPGNIKIGPDGSIFLVDFGLVKVVQGSGATTMGAQSLTPGYAPPEQYGKGTDQRSDIYSLGATLYAALTGKVPEDGISRAMGNCRLTPITNHRKSVSPQLVACIEKAMSVEPESRFQNAREFKGALLNLAGIDQTTEKWPANSNTIPVKKQPDQNQPPKKKTDPIRILGLGSAIILFIAAVFLAESFARKLMLIGSPPEGANVPIETKMSTAIVPSLTIAPTSPGSGPAVVLPEATKTIAPAQNGSAAGSNAGLVAFASDQDGIPQIYTLKVSAGTAEKMTNLPEGACQPDWSPDGRQIVFISPCSEDSAKYPTSSLFIIDVESKNLRGLKPFLGGEFEPDWSPDGKSILFTSLGESETRRDFYIYDLSTDQVTKLTNTNSFKNTARWSPDGSFIAFVENKSGIPQLFIMNRDGTDPKMFTTLLDGPAQFPGWSPDGRRIVFTQGDKSPGLMVKEVSGSGVKPVPVNDRIRPAWNASYSSDGKWLVYVSNGDIWIISADGTGAKNLTNSEGKEFDPAWQP